MEKILIQDNFFDNAYDLRELALSTRFFSAEENNYEVGWRGYRTNEMRDLDKNILKVSCQKIKDELIKFFNLKIDEDEGNFYFHIALTHTKNTLENFDINKFHIDDSRFAGIVYLSPNPPPKTGTTIIINDENKDIENKFNRLVAYPSSLTHAPSDLFGDTMETGRLTISFFV